MKNYDMPKYELLCDGVKVAHFDKIGDKWKFNTDFNIWRESFMLDILNDDDKWIDTLYFHNQELRDEYIRQNNLKIQSVNTKTIKAKY